MMKNLLLLFLLLNLFSCKSNVEENEESPIFWHSYDESEELEAQASHENPRMRFKLINSKYLDKNDIWTPFEEDLANFSEEDYQRLKPLILEKNIPELQKSINESELTYTDLTLFYIYRIRKFESDNELSLNAIISLNPDVVEQAKKLDAEKTENLDVNSIYGMPILLKDNINTAKMPTTAGAIALAENRPPKNAFIAEKLLEHNALILGKANLSEWAYFFCDGCPLGYSAVGGQTLNPYERKVFESGGSSSGSGVAIAANFAIAAVGTETAGSILSPSSKNSVVGLKPTVGLLSRTGIVPISSTLDTPGPMTKSVIDNAILLNALTGKDEADEASIAAEKNYLEGLTEATLEGKRVGVIKDLLEDSLYNAAVQEIKNAGAVIIEFDAPEVSLDGFLTLLNADMKKDLPAYISKSAGKDVQVKNIKDIVKFNLEDSLIRMPYGQQLFEGIVADTTSAEELEKVATRLRENGRKFFDEPMKENNLDVIISIDNHHAALAAVAKYPAITVPMGYKSTGEPEGLTFIAKPFEEAKLLKFGFAFEKASQARKIPEKYN